MYKATLAPKSAHVDSKRVVAVKTLKGKDQCGNGWIFIYVLHLAGYFDQTEIDKIIEESLKMRKFKHPHVMGLIGVCLDAGPAPYIVMPYMANGSLLSYLKKERGSLVLKEDADEDLVNFCHLLNWWEPLTIFVFFSPLHLDRGGLQASNSDLFSDC